MKLPVGWLADYVDINESTHEIAEAMTMSGSKVEGVSNRGKDIKRVVVGRILSVERHPDADKLLVTQTDVGEETVQIVTGATNIKEGDLVPVALHGAELPGGVKIKKEIKSLESNG